MSIKVEIESTSTSGDLDWTGNHFLAEEIIARVVDQELQSLRFTKKGPISAQPLRQEIAKYYDVDCEWVVAGVGSSHILDALMRFYSGREILDVIPNFKMAKLSRHRDQCPYRAISVREPGELLPKVRAVGPSTESVLVLSSPRNPFGYAFPAMMVEELLGSFPGTVIVDEAYTEFSSINIIPLLHRYRNLILVRTFSKAWGIANLRVGYALSGLLGSVFRDKYLLPYCLSELQQRVASALLRNPGPIQRSIQAVAFHRKRFLERLNTIEGLFVWDSQANYICVESPDADSAISALAEAGISVGRLHSLPNYPPEWPAGFRISVCRPSVEDKVIHVLSEVAVRQKL